MIMNRILTNSRAVGLVIAACLGGAASAASPALAQCAAPACNASAHHWSGIGYTSSTDGRTAIGMWQASPGKYYPTMCRWNASLSKWMLVANHQTAPAPYAAAQLTGATSICLGTGNDQIERFTVATSCWLSAPGGSITVVPFDNNGHELKVSGEGGNDVIDLRTMTGPGALCGGTGNDQLLGGNGYQYMSGQNGADLLNGGPNTDNVRGADGGDVLTNSTYTDGADLFRGENDNDCLVFVFANIDPASSCGPGADHYTTISGRPPIECETPTNDCCSLSDAC
jgi:hypothetical protein